MPKKRAKQIEKVLNENILKICGKAYKHYSVKWKDRDPEEST
jgi:hypothetical protein